MTALSEAFGVRVPVRADTDDFDRDLRRKLARVDASKSGKQVATRFGVGMNGAIGGIVSKSAGIFAAGFAAIKVGGFLKGAIGDASDLGETMSKSASVFGKANKEILAFGRTSADSIGQSKAEATAAASQFGNMFNQLGIGQKPAADMSIQMVKLASDFASFHNADITEVLEAQQAAFRGEFDSVQKFVPTINAAAVEQEAMRLKLAGSTKELTQQDKAVATHSLLIKGAGKAQGDFARTSGGMANQQRILSASFADFKANLGTALLPVVTKFFTFLNDRGVPVLKEIAGGFNAFSAAFKANDGDITSSGFPGFMEKVGFAARGAFDYFKTDVLPRLREFAGFVRDEVVPRIRDVAVYLAQQLGPVIKDFVEAKLAGLKKVFGDVKQAIAENRPQLEQLGNAIKNVAKFIIEQLIPFLAKVSANNGPLKILGAVITNTIRTVSGLVTAFNAIKEPIRIALKFVIDKFLGMVGSVIDGAANAFGWVPELGGKLKNAAKDFKKFRDDVNRALDGVDDEAVRVSLFTSKAPGGHVPIERASGGPVFGPGTSTSDSINARLSKGEHVLSAREVIGAGGHAAVAAMRSVWAKASRFARGGPVGLTLRDTIPGFGAISSLTRGIARDFGREIARQREALGVNPGLNGVLDFVRSQVGKPYLWGGVGPGGYDCSGLVSAAINRAFGRKPYSRLGATGSMPWGMMAPGPGAFMVGWFKGNPGHTAATVNRVNIESAGGVGVRMGAAARGASNSLFTHRMHVKGFARGGAVLGDLPYDLLKGKRELLEELGLGRPFVADRGVVLGRGVNVLDNRTGRPEPLARTDQPLDLSDRSIRRLAEAMTGRSMRIETRGGQQFATLLPSNG